jgi:outer membrane protein insertion porin family
VVEVEPVYPVRFEDLGVPEAELTAWLKSRDPLFSPSIPATAPVLDRYAREIEARVKEKVAGRVVPAGPEKFAILFRPARPLPAVAQVIFTGNKVVPVKALQDAAGGVAIGLPYTEPRFREVLDASVRPLYEARGRVRVAFPKIAVEPAKDVTGLVVTVVVEEGESYDLGEVRIEGAPGFKREDLLKTGNFKTGDIANFEIVQQGLERIRNALRRSGYLNAQTAVERKIDDARKTVDLNVRIDEGAQYTFGSLEIVGLDLHGEAAVRRMWTPKPGKPFNADYPDHFLNRIKEEHVFDNLQKTRAAVKLNDQERTADVTLYFNK